MINDNEKDELLSARKIKEKSMPPRSVSGKVLLTKLAKITFLELIALAGSAAIMLAFGFFTAIISDYLYNGNHSIPNQAERGYDLGNGFVVVFSVIGSMFFCLPLVIWFHFYIFRKYFK